MRMCQGGDESDLGTLSTRLICCKVKFNFLLKQKHKQNKVHAGTDLSSTVCVCVFTFLVFGLCVCVCARLIGFTKIDQEVSFIIAKQINAEWALHIRSRMCVRMCLYISQLKPIAIIFDPRPRAPRSINCQCSPKTLLCSSSKRRRGFIFDVLPPVRLAPPPSPLPQIIQILLTCFWAERQTCLILLGLIICCLINFWFAWTNFIFLCLCGCVCVCIVCRLCAQPNRK